MPTAYINRLSELRTLSNSNKARLLMYEAGFKIFKENPILGIGFNNIRNLHQETELLNFLNYEHRQLHNIFINIAAELGLIGLISFISLLILTLKRAWDNIISEKNYLTIGAFAIIIGQLIQNTVDVMMHTTQVGLIFVFFIALINLKNKNLLKLMSIK